VSAALTFNSFFGPGRVRKERAMKITVVKKSSTKVKTMSSCPWLVESPVEKQK
jgi:hypothetical protein